MKKLNRESGIALIMVALSMSFLLGFVALSTDVGILLHEKRQLQTAADAAALGGATELLAEGNPSSLSSAPGVYTAASTDAGLNGFQVSSTNGSASSTGVTLSLSLSPNIGVPTFNTAGYVQATISQSVSTPLIQAFMGLFGNTSFSGMQVAATAIASDTISSNGCVYVQDPATIDPAVSMQGNSFILTPKCGVTINGNLSFTGSKADIEAGFIGITGTVSGSNLSGQNYETGIPPQPNPMAQLNSELPSGPYTPNTSAGCTLPSGAGTSNCYYDYGGGNLTTAELTTLGDCSGGVCTLPSGVYVFDEPVLLNGAISSAAGGVMIYLTKSVAFDFDANGTVNLAPLTSGIFRDVLIDAPTDGPAPACVSGKGKNGSSGELYFDFGSSTTTLTGIVYAPEAELFEQDSGATMTIDTDLVIGTVCQQSATFSVNGLQYDSPITKVGLVY